MRADFKRSFCTFLLVALKTVLWSLLFVVPGIIAAIRYSLSFFILADNPDIKARDAIEKSKQMMKGKKLKYCIVSICFTTFYGFGNIIFETISKSMKLEWFIRISHGPFPASSIRLVV